MRPTSLLVAFALLALMQEARHLAQCSSYLDEYFLPTAKLALNKLQQSLSSSSAAQEQQAGSSSSPTATQFERNSSSEQQATEKVSQVQVQVASEKQPAPARDEQQQQQQQQRVWEEPNKGDFVRLLELGGQEQVAAAASSELPAAAAAATPTSAPTATPTTGSSSSSSTTTPATATPTEQSAEPEPQSVLSATQANGALPGELQVGEEKATLISSEAPPPPRVEGAESSAPAAGERPALVLDAPLQAEEAARETELEAVAAVDASIGFGQSDLFGALADSCYDEYGNARFCEPEFENAAFERQLEASSECGQPASRFCTAFLNEHNDQIRNCHICDAQHPKKRHPAAYLTDLNNFNAPTCWVSAPLVANGSSEHLDNVSLTLNLDKKYEISYISMQFCSMRPDSLAIYKSSDFGRSWQPYQFYSSQCARVYNRAPRPLASLGGRPALEAPEASCVNSSSSSSQAAATSGTSSGRVAFSPLGELRGSQQLALERSSALQDWISATNLRVVLDRQQPAAWAALHASQQPAAAVLAATNSSSGKEQQAAELTNPSDAFNYALADLTVGARCKCNGHASRCVHGKEGRLQCDCRHNTAGRDCEKCAPFHFDRPWMRATQNEANPCQPCNCNGHSRKCRFDAQIYQLSGRRSGGVCHGCRDNTEGRHCHYCKEGFTRDHSKPMSDKEACKHCDCHPLGSKGRVCDQATGQCPCKEGVAGLQCNRCAQGYQQSTSSEEPCIKLPENDINYEPSLSVDGAVDESAGADQRRSSAASAHSIASTDNNNSEQQPGAELQPPADANQEPEELSKEDDFNSEQPTNELGATRHQLSSARSWPNQAQLRPGKQQPYYRYRARQQPLYKLEAAGAELDEQEAELAADFVPRQQQQQFAAYANDYNKRGFGPRRQRVHKPPLEQPDDLMVYDDQETPVYVAPPNSMYNDDSFNLIHPALQGQRRQQQQQQQHLNQRGQGHYASRPLGKLAPPFASQARRQFAAEQEAAQAQAQQARAFSNSIACGDCHLATRRLVFKQFCHLDYAIRANVLSKQVADDWTKFELELLDIFKSPSSGLMAANQVAAYLEAGSPGQLNEEAGNRKASNSSSDLGAAQHRIKVGSLQTIWVPTEDLSCKCPKLKPKSMYLLMGSMDAKENSASSFQLDRHGVALEWRASLQDKLIKYQRRHSRGRC